MESFYPIPSGSKKIKLEKVKDIKDTISLVLSFR
jgi:hypothetical protein